jgi:hypothetical protein
MGNYLKDFSAVLAKKSVPEKKISSLLSNGGIFINFLTTDSNESIWYPYSKVTRATLIFTLINVNEITVKIYYASVTVAK